MSDINELIAEIKIEGKDEEKMNELWEEVSSLVYSISHSYAMIHGYDYDDVRQNSFLAWHNLTRTFKMDKMQGDNIEANYISYLNKFLDKRLNDYKDSYSLYKNSQAKFLSVNRFNESAFLSEELQTNNIDDTHIRALSIAEKSHLFSPREREVYDLLKQGYENDYIAEELEISSKDVYRYKKRMEKKI